MNLLQKYRPLIIWLFLLAAFLPYLYISQYCNPIADDFIYAFKYGTSDLSELLPNEYLNWNGRYISNFFVLVSPMAFGSFLGHKLFPIVTIAFSIFSFYLLLRALTGSRTTRGMSLLCAVVLTLLYLYQMPIISDGIYQYTGAVTYQLGCSFLLIYIAALVWFFQGRYLLNSKAIHLVLVTLLLFISIGFNEILMIAMWLFSVVTYLIVWKNGLGQKQMALFILIAASVFSGLMYFAPGNHIRTDLFQNTHQLFSSLFMSMAQTARFSFEWISSAPLLLLSILYFQLNKKLSGGDNLFSRSFYLTPVTCLILLFLVVFIGSFPAYWSTGILGQHRTMNISYFLFIMMWFVSLTVFCNFKKLPDTVLNIKLEWMLLVLIWGSLVFTKNGYDVIMDLKSNSAYEYNELMNDRYALIQNPEDTVYFKAIPNPPKTIFVLDITHNPNHWINRGYNLYFHTQKKIMLE